MNSPWQQKTIKDSTLSCQHWDKPWFVCLFPKNRNWISSYKLWNISLGFFYFSNINAQSTGSGVFFFGSLPNLFFRIDIFLSAAALDPWTVDKYHPQAVVHAQNPHYKIAAGQRRSKSFQVHLVKYGTRFSVPGRRNQHVSLLLSGTPTSQSQVGDLWSY